MRQLWAKKYPEKACVDALQHKQTILKLTICIRGTSASTLDLEESRVDALQDERKAAFLLVQPVQHPVLPKIDECAPAFQLKHINSACQLRHGHPTSILT